MKRLLQIGITFLFSINLFAQTQTAFAIDPAKGSFFMTPHYLTHGRTIADENESFFLGIGPKVLDQESLITVEPWDIATTPIPAGLQPISESFVYDIKMPRPAMFPRNKPVVIRLSYQSENPFQKRLYHWDNNQQRWQMLPTKLNTREKYMTAWVHFPYTQIIALEDPTITEAPKKIGTEGEPDISSQIAIVMDSRTKTVLYEKNKDLIWWPASVTKLLSAIVFLSKNPNFTKTMTYEKNYDAIGGRLKISAGETLTVKDIFFTTLVGSANNTANMLPDIVSLSKQDFIEQMNRTAQSLGMNHSTFSDVSGLSTDNHSTAFDLALLAEEAGKFPEIFQATNMSSYSFNTQRGGKFHRIKNTNTLLGNNTYRFIVGKTGYLDESGYNNVVKIKNKNDDEIIIVILGAPNSSMRFSETNLLANYILNNYQWGKP